MIDKPNGFFKKFLFVTIDGLDGSGKETLSNKLEELLTAENIFSVTTNMSFPYYKSKSGQYISEYLANGYYTENDNKIYPDFDQICQLFADNRQEYFMQYGSCIEICNIIDKPCLCISDRYVGSNFIYQGKRFYDKSNPDKNKIIEARDKILSEYDKYPSLPKPDLSIYLNIPYDILRDRLDKRTENKNGNKDDLYEKDNFLKEVYSFMDYCMKNDICDKVFTNIINGIDNTGHVKTPDELAREIVDIIKAKGMIPCGNK